MRRPGGWASLTDRETGKVTGECDTTTCAHCNAITHVKAGCRPEDIGGLCKLCMGLICPKCVGGDCVPFLKKIEIWEERNHALRSYGITVPF